MWRLWLCFSFSLPWLSLLISPSNPDVLEKILQGFLLASSVGLILAGGCAVGFFRWKRKPA